MITLQTVPRRLRVVSFGAVALFDLGARWWAATLQDKYVAWSSNMSAADTFTTIGEATAVAVPVILAPLILSPVAYLLGQLLVLVESRWVRFVSAIFIAASFVIYDAAAWLSVFVALLGYLILVSGMVGQRVVAHPTIPPQQP